MSIPSLPTAEESLGNVRTLCDFPGNDAEDLPFKKGEILVGGRTRRSSGGAPNKDGRVGTVPCPTWKLVRASAQGKPGTGIPTLRGPEPAHASRWPADHAAPPQVAGAPGTRVWPRPRRTDLSLQKQFRGNVPCAYDKTAWPQEVKAARLGLWGFDT